LPLSTTTPPVGEIGCPAARTTSPSGAAAPRASAPMLALQLLINGLVTGSALGVVAVSFSLIFLRLRCFAGFLGASVASV